MRMRIAIDILLLLILVSSALGQETGWSSRLVELPMGESDKSPPVYSSLAVQPGVPVVAAAGDDHIVRLWEMPGGEMVAALSGHSDWVRGIVFSPRRHELASCGNDHSIILWDLATQNEKRRFDVGFAVAAIAYSPDGLQLAAVGYSNELLLFTLDSDVAPARLKCPCQDMRALTFSSDGQWLAAGGRSGVVQIWDIRSHEVIDKSATHRGRVRAIAFTEDGSRLISCGDDRRICVREWTSEGWETRELPRRPAKFLSFALIDGLIVVGGTDNQIRLWDLDSYSELAVLAGHEGSVGTLEPFGEGFISGSFDTTVRIWTRTQPVSKP